MAYNNYFPMGYQPYPQNYLQNYPQVYPQQNTQQAQQNNGIVWVQGIEGAKAHPVGAGQSVLLMDSDSDCMYLKSADQTGMPSLRVFDYKERTSSSGPKNDDLSVFATKDELSHYVTKEELKKAILDARKKKGKDDE